MKKIGLVGGLGPASTVDYYFKLIEKYRCEFGIDEYPQIIIDSVNMHDVINSISNNKLDDTAKILSESISNLKAAGAEVAAITANTPHIAWDNMKDLFEIPVISIVDETVKEILMKGYKRVLVLGTVFTMKSNLYKDCLESKGITPIFPSDTDKEIIGDLIYPNLENGIIIPEDREKMIALAEKYIKIEKADALLLGCTEIPLVIKEGDASVPVLDTTQIHINAIYKCLKG